MIELISSKVLIIYYFTPISSSLARPDKKLVALNSFGLVLTITKFKSVNNLLSYVIDLLTPLDNDILNFNIVDKFSKFKKDDNIIK